MKVICLFALVCCWENVVALPQLSRKDVEDYAITLTASSGIISSPGYPNGYTTSSSESWKLRVPGAERYEITFLDMDLDTNGCYDYVVLYDDDNWAAPGDVHCNDPGEVVNMRTSEITVSFVTGYSVPQAMRGSGFSLKYVAYGNVIPTTPTVPPSTTIVIDHTSTSMLPTDPATTEPPSTTEVNTVPTSTTIPPTSATQQSTTTYPQTGNFPPGNQDDSDCGNPSVKPQITGFDYEAQGDAVSYFQSSRVVNGEETVPHSWPWQVSLQGSYGMAYCGGTLVDDIWVVTAAHCAELIFIGTYGSDQAALGMHDKSAQEASVQLIDIVAVYTHPEYDNPDRSHDVAMVKLKEPAVFNEYVSPACEAHAGWVFPAGMQCVVTGWGVTVEGGSRGSDKLQQAPLPLLSDQACYDLYQQANLDTTQDMQCAGGQGKGACNGDSGGPLNCYVNNRWYHMGIVSFGEANCDTEIAGVFARVAELRSFIDSVINQFS